MRVKVCGMTDMNQVRQLNDWGIHFCGFIFYPKSPRYVLNTNTTDNIKKVKGNINKVGVFVNEKEDTVLKMVDDCGLYLVQLHGDESPRTCENLSNYATTVKAFRMSEQDNVLWKIKDYQDVVDMFLFDTEGVGYGGTGKKFNWSMLKGLSIRKPFFLSGGIQPEDVHQLAEFMQDPVAKDLFAVDINSRFEIAPGIKNLALVQEFVNEVTNI
ncbi:MAG: phosphoribosylanthranilate isomerase [Sphingobacteriales bacterium]|uniref:phosphoribosylanthranilate isomerase n=1 Tax=Hydrotalea flava TaxID=714549 RepID=UPI00082E4C33|nr:phosphoribosylanthranilate isomerase [Hydrotalea flava]RTL56688.1 MAG: phosphoribosylanthranilate isomerase [Sphingobacteriales bacterium]